MKVPIVLLAALVSLTSLATRAENIHCQDELGQIVLDLTATSSTVYHYKLANGEDAHSGTANATRFVQETDFDLDCRDCEFRVENGQDPKASLPLKWTQYVGTLDLRHSMGHMLYCRTTGELIAPAEGALVRM